MTEAQKKRMEYLAENSINRNMHTLNEADGRVYHFKRGYQNQWYLVVLRCY